MKELGKKKVVIEVDYSELDELIEKQYGRKYECVAYEEWSNYESHSFDVQKEKLDDYDKEKIDNWNSKNGSGMYMTTIFLNDMCNRGVIEPGEYLVNVYW